MQVSREQQLADLWEMWMFWCNHSNFVLCLQVLEKFMSSIPENTNYQQQVMLIVTLLFMSGMREVQMQYSAVLQVWWKLVAGPIRQWQGIVSGRLGPLHWSRLRSEDPRHKSRVTIMTCHECHAENCQLFIGVVMGWFQLENVKTQFNLDFIWNINYLLLKCFLMNVRRTVFKLFVKTPGMRKSLQINRPWNLDPDSSHPNFTTW